MRHQFIPAPQTSHFCHSHTHMQVKILIYRGATALLVAVETPAATRLAVAQAKLVPINAHATWQPRSVNREQLCRKEDGHYYSTHNLASTVSFLACKRQGTTAITAVWSESSCAFPKDGTATGSRRERSSNGGHGETKALVSPAPR